MAKKKSSNNSDNGNEIVLSAMLSINAASGLRGLLMQALENEGPLELDASNVERITTPCIQVLLAAEKSASASGRKLVLTGYSKDFEEAFSTLGLSSYLESWSN